MEAIKDFMANLKDQPALLTLSVSNFTLLIFIFYALHGAAEARTEIIKLLAQCAVKTTQ